MKQKTLGMLVVMVLFSSAMVAMSTTGEGATLTVGEGGDHQDITSALEAAADGDTITIKNGEYEWIDVKVDKSVTIQGESKDGVKIISSDPAGLFKLIADDITISKMTLSVQYSEALRIDGSGITISDVVHLSDGFGTTTCGMEAFPIGVVIKDSEFQNGLLLDKGEKFSVTNCVIGGYYGSSVSLTASSSEFTGCTVSGGGFVINQGTTDVVVQDCTFMDHDNSCFILSGQNCKVYSNHFENLGGDYGNAMNLGGKDNEVKGNTFTKNRWGISIMNADDEGNTDPLSNVITQNNFADNTEGGVLWYQKTRADSVDATNNWWGDASGPAGDGPGSGDKCKGNVAYEPWLTAESTWTPDTAEGEGEGEGEGEDDVWEDTTDTDGDGLPDWWEEENGMDPEDETDATDELISSFEDEKDSAEEDASDDDTDDDTSDDDKGDDDEDDEDSPGFESYALVAIVVIVALLALLGWGRRRD